MTTIIVIVVVALVFFVAVCVVSFMIWKREAEMRTDSIKAIEENLEKLTQELAREQHDADADMVYDVARETQEAFRDGDVRKNIRDIKKNIEYVQSVMAENASPEPTVKRRRDPFEWVRDTEFSAGIYDRERYGGTETVTGSGPGDSEGPEAAETERDWSVFGGTGKSCDDRCDDGDGDTERTYAVTDAGSAGDTGDDSADMADMEVPDESAEASTEDAEPDVPGAKPEANAAEQTAEAADDMTENPSESTAGATEDTEDTEEESDADDDNAYGVYGLYDGYDAAERQSGEAYAEGAGAEEEREAHVAADDMPYGEIDLGFMDGLGAGEYAASDGEDMTGRKNAIGYDVGRSGKKYTASELEDLIKE